MIGAAKLNNELSFCKVTVCFIAFDDKSIFIAITKNEMKVDTSQCMTKQKNNCVE